MSWGGALGGMGRGLSSIANKYIDEELAQERAKMLADLQLKSAKDLDEYQLSDERQAKLRDNATQATLSQASATRQAATDGVNDTAYQDGLNRNSQLTATRAGQATVTQLGIETPARVDAANRVEEGTRASLLTTAREKAKIEGDARIRVTNATRPEEKDPLAKIKPVDRERLAGINAELKQINEQVVKAKATDGGWDTKRNPAQAELMERVQILATRRDAILDSYSEGQGGGLGDLVKQAREASGKANAPAPGQAQGAAPTPKKAEPAPAKTYEQLSAEFIANADDRQLRQLAKSKGHKDQKAAEQELARRKQLWEEADAGRTTSGFGFN
jgi:hypothetical protein